MQKTNCISKKLMGNIIRYVLVFLAVILTPLLAKPIAKLFDFVELAWSNEGLLRPFFVELFTAIFWLLEWIGFFFLDKYLKKRFAQKQENSNSEMETMATDESVKEAAFADADVGVDANEATAQKQKGKKAPLFKQTPLLPMKNVAILFLIAAACIVVVTLQIGFKVKPFYELGDKTTYTKMLIKGGEVIRNLVKGIWIVSIMKTALSIMEELPFMAKVQEKTAPWIKWLGVCVLAVAFGIFEIFVFANPFVWTYILFYVAFTAVYFFTEQAPVKSYLLICFIYIF